MEVLPRCGELGASRWEVEAMGKGGMRGEMGRMRLDESDDGGLDRDCEEKKYLGQSRNGESGEA